MIVPVVTDYMHKRTLPQRLRSLSGKEFLALSCIALFLTFFAFVISWFVFQSSAMDAGLIFHKRAVVLLFFGIPSVMAWHVACAGGNELASVFCEHTLKRAVSAKTFLKAIGDEDVDSFLNAVRQYGLSVYRLPQKLPSAEQENVACRLEPLFASTCYAFFMRSHFYSKELFCLDAEQVEHVFSQIVKALMLSRPALIRDQADSEMEKRIQTLQTELDATKKKLGEKSLAEGPHKRVANARLAVIAQLAASGFARDALLKDWEEGKTYSKKEINEAYKNALDDHNLKPVLHSIKDTGYDELDEDAMRVFRAFMPNGTINWGGDEKRVTPATAIKSIMGKSEKA